MVVKHDHMLQHGVLRVLPVPVDIRLHDLLNLRAGQQRSRRPVIGTADQHLAGTDRIALPEPAILVLLAIGLEPKGRIEVRDYPHRPARCIGSGAGCAVGEDLRRRHALVSRAERADVAGRDRLFSGLAEGIGPACALRRHRHPSPGNQVLP